MLNRIHALLRSRDEGSAMATVISVVVVTTILAALLGSTMVHSIGQTTASRADTQARAAAEAGADAAEYGLTALLDCTLRGGVYTSATTPRYTATVFYRTTPAASAPTLADWTPGCPLPTATGVRVESVGYADAKGAANSSGDIQRVEAIFAHTPTTSTITASGGAIQATQTTGFNQLTVTTTTGTVTPGSATPDVIVENGDYTCTSGTTIQGNLIVKNGSVKLDTCIILGSLKVSGNVTMNSSKVGGDLIATGVQASLKTDNANVYGYNSIVGGSLQAAGSVKLNKSSVTGDVTAAMRTGSLTSDSSAANLYDVTIGGTLKTGGKIYAQTTKILGSVIGQSASSVVSLIAPDVRISGNLQLSGKFSTWNVPTLCHLLGEITQLVCALTNGIVGGTADLLVSTLTQPAAPSLNLAASVWAGYTYSATQWQQAGYTVIPWTGSCTVGSNNGSDMALIASIQASAAKIVVDARSCTKLVFINDRTPLLKFNADVAFISNGFEFNSTKMQSGNGTTHQARFIVPGATPQSGANICATTNIGLNANVKIELSLNVLFYTPGCIRVNGTTTIPGQVYAGAAQFDATTTIQYVPIGLPGVNLETGAVTNASVSVGGLGQKQSVRDLPG